MIDPSEQTWRVRLADRLDSLAAWAQEKGAWRWVGCALGIGCMVFWWRSVGAILGARTSEGGDAVIAYGYGLGRGVISFAALIAGAILISPMIVPFVARPFCRFIDTVYLGGSAIERPPLTFDVAERRMIEGRFEEAAIEFERLASWHPHVARIYVDGIRAARLAGNEKLARRLFRRGRLRCPRGMGDLRASLERQPGPNGR